MTHLDWEKARRTRKGDYGPDFSTAYFWQSRLVKHETRCCGCGGPVLRGSRAHSAKMRRTGTWYFMHTPCYLRKGHSPTRV